MKRIVLAGIACLSLLVVIPAVSTAHSSAHHAGRDRRLDDHRPGDRHRGHERGDRFEHGAEDGVDVTGVVRSFANGRLTVTRPDGSSVSGAVTAATRIGCAAEERDPRESDDEGDDPGCVAMLHQPGTTVGHAERRVFGGRAVWAEIELRV